MGWQLQTFTSTAERCHMTAEKEIASCVKY